MKMDISKENELSELITLHLQGDNSLQEHQQLIDILNDDAEAVELYVEYMMQYSALYQPGNIMLKDYSKEPSPSILDSSLWEAMAHYESQAPKIEFPEVIPQRELIQNVVYPPRERRKISRFGVFTLVNVAAFVLLFLLLRFAPPKGGIEVATLTDSLDAKWVDVKRPMHVGTRLPINKSPVLLSEGLVELDFDNNASVVIEGPAEFRILAEDRIGLNYGKVYVTVPKEAIGFSVYTKHAKIIDLGTEFGVAVDTFGDTRLHVIEGRTALLVDDESKLGSVEVTDGTARKVVAATSRIVDVPYDSRFFVRAFDSRSRMVWKGQNKTLSLADLVGGGNGFGTGTLDMGIDPISGEPSIEPEGTRWASNDYRLVASTPYVDGVFVPNGRTEQMVSSRGHVFRECPQTSGLCCENIANVIRNLDALVTQTGDGSDLPARAILMHANMGITFDLQALRSLLPGAKITRFQSQFGIRKWAVRPDGSNADFWILVDGQLRHKKERAKINEFYSVDIELSKRDRFLTLIITEGDDPAERYVEGRVLTPIDSDRGMFIDPVLALCSQ